MEQAADQDMIGLDTVHNVVRLIAKAPQTGCKFICNTAHTLEFSQQRERAVCASPIRFRLVVTESAFGKIIDIIELGCSLL